MNFKKLIIFDGKIMSLMQISALLISVIGIFFVDWTIQYVFLSIFFYYVYSTVGVSLMLHRYWAHRSFEFKNKYIRLFFVILAILSSRGSPLAWAHIHRTHHRHADKSEDPHRPENFSFFSFKTTYISEIKLFLIKDFMTKEHKVIHEYYIVFILLWVMFLLSINFNFLYFVWALPVFLNQISQDLWNYFSHKNIGYRNFDTNDNSKNVWQLFPLILGEAWHNNHHGNSKSFNTSIKKWEIDPLNYLILMIKK